MSDYFSNVLALCARIDELAPSGLIDRALIVEANAIRLDTLAEIKAAARATSFRCDRAFPDFEETRR